MKFGSSYVKIKDRVSTNVLSKSNHTHGGGYIRIACTGKSRVGLRFNLQKATFYAGVCLAKTFQKSVFIMSNTEFKF